MKAFFAAALIVVFSLGCFSQSLEVLGLKRSESREKAIEKGYSFISTAGESKECDVYYSYHSSFTVELDQGYKNDTCIFFTFSGPTSIPESMEHYKQLVNNIKTVFIYNEENENYELFINDHLYVLKSEIAYDFSKWMLMVLLVY